MIIRTINCPTIEGLLEFYLETKNQPRKGETKPDLPVGPGFLSSGRAIIPEAGCPTTFLCTHITSVFVSEHPLPQNPVATEEVRPYPSAHLLWQTKAGQRIEGSAKSRVRAYVPKTVTRSDVTDWRGSPWLLVRLTGPKDCQLPNPTWTPGAVPGCCCCCHFPR